MRTSWRLSTASGFQIRVESLLLTSGSAAAVCSMSLCWTRVVAWGVSTATRSCGGSLYPEGQRMHGCPSMARCRPLHPTQRHHLERHGLLFLWRQWQQRRRMLLLTFAPLILRAPPLRYIRRLALFLAGDWDKLFRTQLQFRDPAKRPQEASPLHHDPRDAKAHRAQLNLQPNQSLTGAAAALRANANPVPPKVGDVTAAFQKLNPQAGEEVPPPVEARTSIGPQTYAEHLASVEFLKGLGLDPSCSDDPKWARRPLRPPVSQHR
jgi:hypothetical protein